MTAFEYVSESGLWPLSPCLRCLFFPKTTSAISGRCLCPGLGPHHQSWREAPLRESLSSEDSGSRAGATAFSLLISERNKRASSSASGGFSSRAFTRWSWRKPKGDRRGDWKGRPLIPSRGRRTRMERGELGCKNHKSWDAGVGEEPSWPLSSRAAPFPCEQPSSPVNSVSEHRTSPLPASSSVPAEVRRGRREAAGWSQPCLFPQQSARRNQESSKVASQAWTWSSQDPLPSKWLVLFLIQVWK